LKRLVEDGSYVMMSDSLKDSIEVTDDYDQKSEDSIILVKPARVKKY
jgi:hypothetical protein